MLRNESFRRVRLLSGLVLVATFGAGILVGVGAHRFVRPPHRHPMAPLHLPLEELDLSTEQMTRAHAVVDSHRGELDTILRGTFPRVRAIHAQIESEVRAILTPAQRDRLDEIEASRPPMPPRPGEGPPPGGRNE